MCIDLDKWYSEFVDERTRYYRSILDFAPEETTTHNNKSDAFKHVFTSATLVLFTTWYGSLLFTNKHEWNNLDNDGPINESVMDFWNNKVGRKVGLKALGWIATFQYSELKLAKYIAELVKNKGTINSPNDTCVEEHKGNPEILFDRDCDCEKFKTYLKSTTL